jgi:tripartite-type tricarboxylate transporter receptor subunit TctC
MIRMVVAVPAMAATMAVLGQDYPSKPVRIVTASAGGGADFISRQLAQGISPLLAQPVVIDNRPSGVIAADAVAKSAPDGYTITVGGGSVWIFGLLQKSPYDVVRDFAPIALVSRQPNMLVVHPSVPAKSVKELIALAKARPGELNYAAASVGSAGHLGSELLKSMAGVNIVWVPYKGSPAAITGLLAGEVHMMITDVGNVAPHVKSGRVRALGVTSGEPTALAPGMPTIAGSGLPGYEAIGYTGVWAPAKTPGAIINRLNQEIVRVISPPEVKERLLNAGEEVVGSGPEQFGAVIKADIARMGKVIKEAGIKVN